VPTTATGIASPVPAELLRLHRYSLSPLLIVGGDRSGRASVALAFHRASPLRAGSFLSLDCAREEARLRQALQRWLTAADRTLPANPLWSAARGTLYLESVGSLSAASQRLLQTFVERGSGLSPGGSREWPGRLAAGSGQDLWELVAAERFLGGLADGLDKIRVALDPQGQEGRYEHRGSNRGSAAEPRPRGAFAAA
jgi:DNA-binding NtrC family response regulator